MKIAIISGYFNPLHVGHLDYMEAAKNLADKLIVIINNEHQVTIKGSTPFMSEEDRIRIVSALRCVDKVVLSRDKDSSVLKTLKHIVIQNQGSGRNHFIFCNGGDRQIDQNNIFEFKVCQELEIPMVDGLGDKIRSSSEYTGLVEYEEPNAFRR